MTDRVGQSEASDDQVLSRDRQPLTRLQRVGLQARFQAGDESMFCWFGEGCVIGCNADAAEGRVSVDTWGCGEGRQTTCDLTPDEARREAMALLQAADWAEFGPGEWRRASYGDTPDRETPELAWRPTVDPDGGRL